MVYSKAFYRPNIFFVIFILLLSPLLSFTPVVSAANNLISNPSAEIGNADTWSKNGWGTNNSIYTIESEGQDGGKSLKVTIDSYESGDSRWSFKDVAVMPNTRYTFSGYYKSSVAIEVDMESSLTTGVKNYAWLGDLPASPTSWSQVTYTITTAENTGFVNMYLPIFSVGWVQVDNFLLTSIDSLPVVVPNPNPTPVTPPLPISPIPTPIPAPTPIPTPSTNGFSRPIVSIDFDDGWKNSYTNGFSVLNEFGYRGSANIVTDTAQNPSRYNNQYMNATEIITLRDQGHKIGSHSATHANLVGLNDGQLQNEIANSKFYLEGLLGQPVNYFVTPFCSYNGIVTSYVQQFYTTGMRNCDYDINTKSNFNPYNIKSLPILNTTTLVEIQNILSETKKNNDWLVFMYHEVKPSNGVYSVTQATLRSQMQAIKDSGIVVLPSDEALVEISSQ
jgi:peptidoglycan/xylan/chitin deacetylase (PgdA/CDA1 family)